MENPQETRICLFEDTDLSCGICQTRHNAPQCTKRDKNDPLPILLQINMSKTQIKYWPVKIKDGKLTVHEASAFQRGLSFMDGDWLLSLEKENRTLQQNKRYWAVLGEAENQGYGQSEDLHEYYKQKFLKRTVPVLKEMHEVVGSSAILKVDEFIEYSRKVELDLQEQGVELSQI